MEGETQREKAARYAPQAAAWEQLQEGLKQRIILEDDWDVSEIRYVGGVDLSFFPMPTPLSAAAGEPAAPISDDQEAVAAYVVLSYPELEVVYEKYQQVTLTLPYICGFLAFREVDPLRDLIAQQQATNPEFTPSVVLVDGCGICHPRDFGLASHLGVLSDIPTIGVSKKLLCVDGWNRDDIKEMRRTALLRDGDTYPINGKTNQKAYGMAVRGKSKVPIFVSQGHRVSLQTSVAIVQRTLLTRIPEPIRQADLRSRAVVRKATQAPKQQPRKRRPPPADRQ